MGSNVSSLEYSQEGLRKFQENFQFSTKLKDVKLGLVEIYREKPTGKTIAILKFKTKSEDEFQDKIKEIDDSMKLVHKHLLHVVGHSELISKGMFSEYEISIYFEWYYHTMDKELEERKAKNVLFQEKEVIYIMDSLISVGAYLQENAVFHGDIRPSTIYLNDQGKVKLNHNWLLASKKTNYQEALEGQKGLYLSPEFFHELGQSTQEPLSLSYTKNDVFAVGMTLLHICALESQHKCYDESQNEVDYNVLSQNMNKMLENYSKNTAVKIKTLIEFYPEKRSSFLELRDSLNFKAPNYKEKELK